VSVTVLFQLSERQKEELRPVVENEDNLEAVELSLDHVCYILKVQSTLPSAHPKAQILARDAYDLLMSELEDDEKYDKLETLAETVFDLFTVDPASLKYIGANLTSAAAMLRPEEFHHRPATANSAHSLLYMQLSALQDLADERGASN